MKAFFKHPFFLITSIVVILYILVAIFAEPKKVTKEKSSLQTNDSIISEFFNEFDEFAEINFISFSSTTNMKLNEIKLFNDTSKFYLISLNDSIFLPIGKSENEIEIEGIGNTLFCLVDNSILKRIKNNEKLFALVYVKGLKGMNSNCKMLFYPIYIFSYNQLKNDRENTRKAIYLNKSQNRGISCTKIQLHAES